MRSFLIILCFISSHLAAQVKVDTSLYTILHYDEQVKMAMDWQLPSASPDTISKIGVDLLEDLVDSAYAGFIRDPQKRPQLLQPLRAYRRQYVAFKDREGDQEVWINFFCTTFNHNWKHDVMIVDDGGGCFFQIRLNRSKKKVVELIPNGIALNNSSIPKSISYL